MTNVIHAPDSDSLPAGDHIFVWPTLTGPAYGTRAALQGHLDNPKVKVIPSVLDTAIEAAKAMASKSGIHTVVVVGYEPNP